MGWGQSSRSSFRFRCRSDRTIVGGGSGDPHGKSWRLGSDHHTPMTSESPASQETTGIRPIHSDAHSESVQNRLGRVFARVLGRRGFAVENAVAQICREGGASLDISPVGSTDSRRLEVVAEGLSLYGGCQLAIDATLVRRDAQTQGGHDRWCCLA